MSSIILNFDGMQDEMTMAVNVTKPEISFSAVIYINETEISIAFNKLLQAQSDFDKYPNGEVAISFGPQAESSPHCKFDIHISALGSVKIKSYLYSLSESNDIGGLDYAMINLSSDIAGLENFTEELMHVANKNGLSAKFFCG